MTDRDDWLQRSKRGDSYKAIARDAGLSDTTVSCWFRRRGYYGMAVPHTEAYSEYPPPVRNLILFYPEGDPRRQWMEARIAAWWQRRAFS